MSLPNITIDMIHAFTKCLDDKLAKDIVVLNMENVSPLYDVFIIASVDSTRQANALVTYLEEVAENYDYPLRHINGNSQSDWILLDFGSIIIHLFTPKARNLYNLERLWGDCERLSWE